MTYVNCENIEIESRNSQRVLRISSHNKANTKPLIKPYEDIS